MLRLPTLPAVPGGTGHNPLAVPNPRASLCEAGNKGDPKFDQPKKPPEAKKIFGPNRLSRFT
jgi:hypothetical protein